MHVVTGRQMRRIDGTTIDKFVPGLTLMERAGQRVYEKICEELSPVDELKVAVFLGRGNNAGDGLVAARLLAGGGAGVQLHYLHDPKELSPDAFKNYAKLSGLRKRGLVSESFLYLGEWEKELERSLVESDLVVDALLGTGISKPVDESYARVIERMNGSGLPVLSVDVPSGVNADTGELMGIAVEADITVTMGLPKLGCLFYPGKANVGELCVGEIGIPHEVVEGEGLTVHILDFDEAVGMLPRKDPRTHKFGMGALLLVAGSRLYAGAARLAAESALRTGCGIVYLAGPCSIREVVQASVPEVIFLEQEETEAGSLSYGSLDGILGTARFDAVAVGPGLTAGEDTAGLVRAIVERSSVPLLLDADGINAFGGRFSELAALAERREIIVSPHSGELKRLTGETGSDVPLERLEKLASLVAGTGITIVHKGAPTVIVHPDGCTYINSAGHPGQATAGSGDVLAGAIAGFMAQGCGTSAASGLGVYVHSRAADIAAGETGRLGMIAGDCMRAMPWALREIEQA